MNSSLKFLVSIASFICPLSQGFLIWKLRLDVPVSHRWRAVASEPVKTPAMGPGVPCPCDGQVAAVFFEPLVDLEVGAQFANG